MAGAPTFKWFCSFSKISKQRAVALRGDVCLHGASVRLEIFEKEVKTWE